MTKKVIAFKPTGHGNETLGGGFLFISYKKKMFEVTDGNPLNHLGALINDIFDFDGTGGRGEETALRIDGEWYILLGDFRKEYEQAFPDKDKCLAVYKAHLDKRSGWSTDDL